MNKGVVFTTDAALSMVFCLMLLSTAYMYGMRFERDGLFSLKMDCSNLASSIAHEREDVTLQVLEAYVKNISRQAGDVGFDLREYAVAGSNVTETNRYVVRPKQSGTMASHRVVIYSGGEKGYVLEVYCNG